MKFKIILLIVITLFIGSCLQRNNPLDPVGNPNVIVPDEVRDVSCTASPPGATHKYVIIRWTANNPENTDGYKVYRWLAYSANYTCVDTVYTNECNHGSKAWHTVLPGDYWYRVSGYKDIYDINTHQYIGRLEGRLSEARFVRVPL